MSEPTRPRVAELADLPQLWPRFPGVEAVLRALRNGESAVVDGAWGSAAAATTAAVIRQIPVPWVIVFPRPRELDDFRADLVGFLGEDRVTTFPAWETLPSEHDLGDVVFGQRLEVLRTLEAASADRPAPIVLTTIQALLQPCPDREQRTQAQRTLKVGDELDLEAWTEWLTERGFHRVAAIEERGEFSIHGGILDLYPPDLADPVRIELFGDEIESLRTFNVVDQQQLAALNEITFSVVSDEVSAMAVREGTGHFCDSLPQSSCVVLLELTELVDEARLYLERLGDPRGLFSSAATIEKLTQHPSVTIAALAAGSLDTTCHLRVESLERLVGPRQQVLEELAGLVGRDESVLIACHNEGARERLRELLAEFAPDLATRVTLCLGSVTNGFRVPGEQLVVLSDNQLFGRTEVHRTPRKKRLEARAIDSFLDLQEGELIVHLTHGIGRFLGMKLLEKDKQTEEHLHLEFRDGVKLFVPVSLIHLVQKYIGGPRATPELSKVGGTAWQKKKQRVTEAVSDLAADMLQLQAARETKPGIVFPPDTHLMEEFEAAFPYQETDDQLKAIHAAKQDMMRQQPMDRLVCGDVGYGKTEIAMRAAFKAVDGGRQVAILVPTTVLAEQHFRSFSARMAEFPVTIESLSRFKSRAEQKDVLKRLADGQVDIVIGTHRLVSKDVHFKDLGLLVIDEEQRFGVQVKDRLKELKLEVDVLTLTATPIPRTLHFSILGLRDISNLETPPQDRVAVETRIARFDPELIRQAIVRELNRNGQVYFVHNRVYNIETLTDRLRSIVPEAKFDIVHGQMDDDRMEAAMLGFVRGETDVLVATTIIESGLDIPNANTIFIHQAENYGLADLHQLRGRVGRYKHRAYCYLLLEEGKSLTPQAAKRLKAIEEFSELGAGFKIAMRDLEIRGAGNILGTEQSGHIAEIGYELYCSLLENAVRALTAQPLREFQHVAVDLPISAYLPNDYVPPGRHKIEIYRKLSSVTTLEQLDQFAVEIRDRFGPVPDVVRRMIEIRRLQLLALAWRIDSIHLEDGCAVFGYRLPRQIRRLVQACPHTIRVVDDRSAFLRLPRQAAAGDRLIQFLQSVLRTESQPAAPATSAKPRESA